MHNLGDAWAAQQIDGNFTTEQINAAALSQLAANRRPVPMGQPGADSNIQVGTDRGGLAVAQGLTDAMIQRMGGQCLQRDEMTGLPLVGHSRAAHPLAGRFRGNAVMMADTFLRLCGRDTTGLSAVQIAQAVFVNGPRVTFHAAGGGPSMTSSDFPYLLANAAGVSMQARYQSAVPQWRVFAAESPANDFREQTIVRLGALPILPEVKEGGEYTHVNFGEEKETWTLVKRGHIVALSWEMIVNDQLGGFNQIILDQGPAAARTDDTLAFAVLTANANMNDGGALFNATAVTTAGGHANHVVHGSGAVPSVATLNAMEAAFGAQAFPKKTLATDADIYLNIVPGVLIVPRALKATATSLIANEYDPAGTAGTLPRNPWNGRLALASHRLLDAQTDSASWYVCTAPSDQPAMILGYLEGYRGPQLTQESGFDTDTRRYKVTHCRVAKATDWRLWYANHGH